MLHMLNAPCVAVMWNMPSICKCLKLAHCKAITYGIMCCCKSMEIAYTL